MSTLSRIIGSIIVNIHKTLIELHKTVHWEAILGIILDLHLLLHTLFATFRKPFIFTDRHVQHKLEKEFVLFMVLELGGDRSCLAID